nr:hypothetical protein B0A51_00385 [Rachicladosporium sp. CCFEE 5018]
MDKVHVSTPSLQIFHYNDLDEPQTHIRLLRIYTAAVDGAIECELQYWAVEHSPAYSAISYTWGDPRRTAVIAVNGLSLTVRQSCALVLCQAHRYGNAYFWVDAICINQSNEDEKSYQVRMMGQIFRRAEAVLACVGHHSSDSAFLCGTLKDHEITLLAIVGQLDSSNTAFWPQFRLPNSTLHQLWRLAKSIAWRLRFTLETHRRIFAAVVAMLERPYFQRVWVAQELFMAKRSLLLCGFDQCEMVALEGLLAISTLSDWGTPRSDAAFLYSVGYRFRNMPFWRRMLYSVTQNIDPDGLLGYSGAESALATPLRYAGSCNARPEESLGRMMNIVQMLQCTDLRDMIYAIVGMLGASIAERIVIDYRNSTFGVAVDVVPIIIGESAARGVLDEAIDTDGDPGLGKVLQVLALSPDDSQYTTAIAARSGNETDITLVSHPVAAFRVDVCVNHWAGHRIWQAGKVWRRGSEDICEKLDRHDAKPTRVIKVEDERGELLAVSSDRVRNGDWLLESVTPWSSSFPGMVLRPAISGKMEIVSTAIFIRSDYPGASATAFSTTFDAEDLATCLYHYTSFWGHSRREVAFPVRPIGIGLAVSPDYPGGIYRPPEIIQQNSEFYHASYLRGKTPADFVDYFAVRLCCETMSSYGEVLMTKRLTVVQPDELGARPNASSSTSAENVGLSIFATANGVGNQHLTLELVNDFPGTVNGYVIGKDSNKNVIFLRPDGSYCSSFSSDVALRLNARGGTIKVTLPDYLDPGRIYLAAGNLHFSGGTQPSFTNPNDQDAAVQRGLVEFTSSSTGMFADLTFVDFVGLPLGMPLVKGDGTTATIKGSKADAVASVCSAMKTQSSKDGRPWSSLCQVDSTGKALRVIAPIHHPAVFENYWNDYVNQVWSYYGSNILTIDTQSINGKVSCRVTGGRLTCDRDEISYAKPTASDIFGCDTGISAIPPAGESDVHKAVKARLCAAFSRATLLIAAGNVQPGVGAAKYYSQKVGNFYAWAVHAAEIDGRGYAFAYDDVSPTGGVQQSGMLVDTNGPKKLTIAVGGW